jgi:predicted DNA-binding protein (MmcQ/YjbR family)
MNRADLVNRCMSKRGAVREQPFGPEVDVVKVMGKVFALIPVDAHPPRISLKCDPLYAQILRENYPAVTPGYHLNKKHWNSVLVDGSVPDDEIAEWIDHSYQQVVKGLTRAQQKRLGEQGSG